MAIKDFKFRGKTMEELRSMTMDEFAKLLPARQARSVKRGFTEQQKKLLLELKKGKSPKTHCRNMIIIPEMVDKTLKVHSGKTFEPVIITEDMLGHYLGEFVLTRKRITHSAPGVGATKSSAAVSVK